MNPKHDNWRLISHYFSCLNFNFTICLIKANFFRHNFIPTIMTLLYVDICTRQRRNLHTFLICLFDLLSKVLAHPLSSIMNILLLDMSNSIFKNYFLLQFRCDVVFHFMILYLHSFKTSSIDHNSLCCTICTTSTNICSISKIYSLIEVIKH